MKSKILLSALLLCITSGAKLSGKEWGSIGEFKRQGTGYLNRAKKALDVLEADSSIDAADIDTFVAQFPGISKGNPQAGKIHLSVMDNMAKSMYFGVVQGINKVKGKITDPALQAKVQAAANDFQPIFVSTSPETQKSIAELAKLKPQAQAQTIVAVAQLASDTGVKIEPTLQNAMATPAIAQAVQKAEQDTGMVVRGVAAVSAPATGKLQPVVQTGEVGVITHATTKPAKVEQSTVVHPEPAISVEYGMAPQETGVLIETGTAQLPAGQVGTITPGVEPIVRVKPVVHGAAGTKEVKADIKPLLEKAKSLPPVSTAVAKTLEPYDLLKKKIEIVNPAKFTNNNFLSLSLKVFYVVLTKKITAEQGDELLQDIAGKWVDGDVGFVEGEIQRFIDAYPEDKPTFAEMVQQGLAKLQSPLLSAHNASITAKNKEDDSIVRLEQVLANVSISALYEFLQNLSIQSPSPIITAIQKKQYQDMINTRLEGSSFFASIKTNMQDMLNKLTVGDAGTVVKLLPQIDPAKRLSVLSNVADTLASSPSGDEKEKALEKLAKALVRISFEDLNTHLTALHSQNKQIIKEQKEAYQEAINEIFIMDEYGASDNYMDIQALESRLNALTVQ